MGKWGVPWTNGAYLRAMIHVNQKSLNPWTDGAYLGLMGIEPLDSDGAYFGLTKTSENQQRGLCSTIVRNHSFKQVKWRKPHRHERNRYVVAVVVVVVVVVIVAVPVAATVIVGVVVVTVLCTACGLPGIRPSCLLAASIRLHW